MDNQPVQPPISAQPPQQPIVTQPSQPSPSRHKSTPIMVLIFVVVLAASLYGIYAWQHKKTAQLQSQVSSLQSQVNKLSQTSKASSAPTPTTTTTDPYAGWLTYSSQSNGITLKYPNTYLASSNDKALFLATTQAEKQQNDSCAKAQECNNFNFGITTQSFKKNAGESYADTVKRNSYTPSTTTIAKIGGFNSFENTDAVKADVGNGYLNFVFIDLPNRVVLIQGQFSQQSDLATFNKIAASAVISP